MYQAAFGLARNMDNHLNAVESTLAEKLDLALLIKDTTNANKLSQSLKALDSLSPTLAKKYAASVAIKPQWFEFNHDELNDKTMPDAVSASIIVTAYRHFPGDRRWRQRWEEAEKRLAGQLSKARLGAIKPVRTMEDLEAAYKLADAFRETAPAISARYRQAIMENIDFAGLVRAASGGLLDPKKLEDARLRLNQVNRVLGDEFILSVGVSMSQDRITRENFFAKLQEVSQCCFSKPSGYQDVNNLYEMVGRFQANRIADFLVKNQKSFSDADKASAIKTLDGMGVTVDFEESAAAKTAKQLGKGNIGYVVAKGWAKLTAGEALRKEMLDIALHPAASGIPLRAGFDAVYYKDPAGKNIATAVKGKNDGGNAKLSYEVEIGTGVDMGRVKDKYGSSLVAVSVGAFTTGERKLADFAASDGNMINYLVSNRDGLILFYPDGTVEIKDIRTLKKSDISTPGFYMKEEPLRFREKVDDFDVFIKKIKKAKASAMQGQLLLYDGQLQVSDKSSGVQDKRRAFAIMEDGSFALIDFEPRITLREEAVLAMKMGVRHLVNLDTGMYDFSQFVDRGGRVHKLGTFDSERPTNLIVFHAGLGAQVPQKIR